MPEHKTYRHKCNTCAWTRHIIADILDLTPYFSVGCGLERPYLQFFFFFCLLFVRSFFFFSFISVRYSHCHSLFSKYIHRNRRYAAGASVSGVDSHSHSTALRSGLRDMSYTQRESNGPQCIVYHQPIQAAKLRPYFNARTRSFSPGSHVR